MRSSRETKICNIVCILLVLFAGVVRLLAKHFNQISCNSFILMLFTSAILIWVCRLRRRLLQPYVKHLLMWVAFMMLFWMAIRTVKYEFLFPAEHFTVRYAWYLFYIPLVFIPLLMFFSVLYIGRPYDRKISIRWNILYVPAFFLVAGVLTNDFHQLAFRFPYGLTSWNNNNYINGPVYYGVVLWVAVLFVAVMVIVFVRCRVPTNRKKIWIPVIPFIIGIIYTVLYIMRIENVLLEMLKLPEMVCFLFAAFMETLIIAHLFPSNDSYSDFWNASSIGAGIMDEEGVIHYKSRHSIPVCEEQIRNAEKQAVILENGKYILRSHRIRGGFCYWTKDVSEINKLNQMLTDTGNVLAEENAMLEAENKMLEEQTGIRQQNSLYDSIARKVKPQLEKISRLIDEPVQEETLFIEKMKYACILNSYVKRCSNLLLMSHQADKIDSDELRLAISESLEYVRLYGIKAYGAYRGKRLFPADNILLAYEVFEAILESAIPGTGAMLLDMEIDDAGLLLHMEINAPKRIFAGEQLLDRIEVQGGRFSIETEQQTEYVSLMLPFGGDER